MLAFCYFSRVLYICIIYYTSFDAFSLMKLQQKPCSQNNLYNTSSAILVGFKPFIIVSTVLEMYQNAFNKCTVYTLKIKWLI